MECLIIYYYVSKNKRNSGLLILWNGILVDDIAQYKSLENDDFSENAVSQIFDVDVLVPNSFSTNHPFMICKT